MMGFMPCNTRKTTFSKTYVVYISFKNIMLCQSASTCSKLTMETPEQCVKSVKSYLPTNLPTFLPTYLLFAKLPKQNKNSLSISIVFSVTISGSHITLPIC